VSGAAAVAAGYIGRLTYVMGGIPAQNRVDCSSFDNLVYGWRLGLAIPMYKAGKYKGQAHGPVVVQWATTGLAVTVHDPQIDDLVLWPGIGALGHMGIYAGNGQFISALGTGLGVRKIPVRDVHKPVPVMYRRMKATSAGLLGDSGGGGSAGCVPGMMMAPMIIGHSLLTGRRYRD
jgi:cell wall-associated NlpC family hydrolase